MLTLFFYFYLCVFSKCQKFINSSYFSKKIIDQYFPKARVNYKPLTFNMIPEKFVIKCLNNKKICCNFENCIIDLRTRTIFEVKNKHTVYKWICNV